MDEMMEILKNLDWSPLFISIKTGIVATIFSFFLGIYAARKVVKTTPGKKAIIDGILTLPMVLPPTVAGFFLLLIFSRRRPFGIFLFENFRIKVVQTWLGCIIAATVISFPLMYRNARAAMEQIDVNLIYAGRTLGMSDTEIFWKVVIPTAGPGIASGTILTFARALGEYGATSMLAGNIPGKTGTISQKIGAGDMQGMRRTVAGAGILSFLIGLFLTVTFMLFMKPLLHLMHTPSDIFADAYKYIMIVSGGILAQMLYNLLSSILRALGNSKIPLYFLIISALLNIVLDLVLIIVFQMGAPGAAIATVVAQGVSGVLCLIYIMWKIPLLHLKKEDWHVGGQIYAIQLKIGLPMALQYSITAIGTMMVQSALNILGSTLVAAFTAASKIEQVVTQAYVAMGTTMATYGAQNIGAGNVPRIRQGFKACTILGIGYSLVAATFIMTIGKYMTYLFVSEDVDIIMSSVDIYLKCIGFFFIPLAIVNIYRNGIQGLGYGLLPMMAGVAELIGRGVVARIAARERSYLGVCLASPAAWVLAGALLIVMYYYIMNVHMKKLFGDYNQKV